MPFRRHVQQRIDRSASKGEPRAWVHPAITVGAKVIVKNRDDTPYFVGVYDDVMHFGAAGTYPHVINDTVDVIVIDGNIVNYDGRLIALLDKMPPIEQWNFISHRWQQIQVYNKRAYRRYKCNCKLCLSLDNLRV